MSIKRKSGWYESYLKTNVTEEKHKPWIWTEKNRQNKKLSFRSSKAFLLNQWKATKSV